MKVSANSCAESDRPLESVHHEEGRMAIPHINRYQLARRAEVHEDVVRDIFAVILACMEEGVRVRIREFGTFIPEIKPQRVVRSPVVPGGRKTIGRRRSMKFVMNRALKKEWTSEVVEAEVPNE